MKILIIIFLYISSLISLDYKTDVTIQSTYYDESKTSTQLLGNSEFMLKEGDFEVELSINYLYTKPYNMQYINVNTLYVAKETKAYTYRIGKMIKFWGALEGYNLTDVFNLKNYALDPFDKSDKIGSWAINASTYMNANNIFEVVVKFYEENQKLPKIGTPFFPLTQKYNSDLNTSTSRYNRTVYVSYNLITDNIIESDSTFIIQDGYDNKRYYTMSNNHALVQNTYKCNKYMFFSNVLVSDTLLKLEASYTKVKDNKLMSDYQQFAVGIEKNINDIFGVDMGLYLEYYNYKYKNKKIEQVDISEIYNNDILLATKINFNDTGSSELRLALLHDLDTKEKFSKVNIKTRIKDKFVVNAEYLYISDSKDSILSNFKNTTRFNVGLTYSF